MSFTENFDNFFDTDDFAVSATWTPSGGDATAVIGIFDNEYFEAGGGEVGAEGSKPAFHCETADIPNAAQGDAIVINTVNYLIINIQPDGTGQSLLILEDQS